MVHNVAGPAALDMNEHRAFRCLKTSSAIIRLAVMLYVGVSVSRGTVEGLLRARGCPGPLSDPRTGAWVRWVAPISSSIPSFRLNSASDACDHCGAVPTAHRDMSTPSLSKPAGT